jgi:hypothetical protein
VYLGSIPGSASIFPIHAARPLPMASRSSVSRRGRHRVSRCGTLWLGVLDASGLVRSAPPGTFVTRAYAVTSVIARRPLRASTSVHQEPTRRAIQAFPFTTHPAIPLQCLQYCARVAKLVDARDLKSLGGQPPCRFDSGPGHHQLTPRLRCRADLDGAIHESGGAAA